MQSGIIICLVIQAQSCQSCNGLNEHLKVPRGVPDHECTGKQCYDEQVRSHTVCTRTHVIAHKHASDMIHITADCVRRLLNSW